MPGLDAENPDRVYQMKAHIFYMQSLWRRFQIGTDGSLEDLRRTILCLFGFRKDFPYLMMVGRVRYTESRDDFLLIDEGEGLEEEEIDLATVQLGDVVKEMIEAKARRKQQLVYDHKNPNYMKFDGEYAILPDEKDEAFKGYAHWDIVVSYEDELPAEKGRQYPVCIDGRHASPPPEIYDNGQYKWLIDNLKEMGRSRFAEALIIRNDPDYVRFAPLLERGFDPLAFDIDIVNRCLAEVGKK